MSGLDFIKAFAKITDTEKRKAEGRKPPIAMCPRCDDEPLVFTFEMTGTEFTCVVCGGWFGFLDPRPADSTPELEARIVAAKAIYREQREARAVSQEGAPE